MLRIFDLAFALLVYAISVSSSTLPKRQLVCPTNQSFQVQDEPLGHFLAPQRPYAQHRHAIFKGGENNGFRYNISADGFLGIAQANDKDLIGYYAKAVYKPGGYAYSASQVFFFDKVASSRFACSIGPAMDESSGCYLSCALDIGARTMLNMSIQIADSSLWFGGPGPNQRDLKRVQLKVVYE